jgi:hypothetical protein
MSHAIHSCYNIININMPNGSAAEEKIITTLAAALGTEASISLGLMPMD